MEGDSQLGLRGDWVSRRPWPNYVRTPCFGPERSMSLSPGRKETKAPGLTPQHGQPSPRDATLRGHQLSHNGTNKKDHPKGVRLKGPWDPEKGKDSEWPSNWAKISPKGVQYCRDHFLKKKCPGNCGRSHNCPVLKNGWVCNAAPSEHNPEQCPHR